MTEDFSKKLSFVFHVVAIAIVIAYAISSYKTFIKNDDLCEVNFKKYHSDKDSTYPSISLCFNTPILDERLKEYTPLINGTDYQSYLLGRNEKITPFLNIPYENVSLQEHHVFTKFKQHFKAENSNISRALKYYIKKGASILIDITPHLVLKSHSRSSFVDPFCKSHEVLHNN